MNQFNAPVYEVDRPTGRCALTDRAFEPGETYIATLTDEADDFKRVDVSLEAWEAGQRPPHVFSYWKAQAPEPTEGPRKLFVDDEVLMNLLERLADAEQPQRIAFRFVLTLILMRKKLLRYDGAESRRVEGAGGESAAPAEQRWWLLTPKLDLSKGPLGKWDDSRRIEVLDPNLDEDGVRAVTDQLSDILQAEL